MIEFISAAENLPFSIAITLMLLIAVFEGVGALLGLAVFSAIDSLLPDFEANLELDADGIGSNSPGALSRVLGWLRIGRVPMLVLLVMFLTAFGLSGFLIQALSVTFVGFKLPALVASIGATFVGFQAMHLSAAVWSKAIPESESSGVSSDDFVGHLATITIGTAMPDKPAEARLVDRSGQKHFVMVRPDNGQDNMPQGAEVLLVRKNGSEFIAIHPESTVLSH